MIGISFGASMLARDGASTEDVMASTKAMRQTWARDSRQVQDVSELASWALVVGVAAAVLGSLFLFVSHGARLAPVDFSAGTSPEMTQAP